MTLVTLPGAPPVEDMCSDCADGDHRLCAGREDDPCLCTDCPEAARSRLLSLRWLAGEAAIDVVATRGPLVIWARDEGDGLVAYLHGPATGRDVEEFRRIIDGSTGTAGARSRAVEAGWMPTTSNDFATKGARS